MYSFPGRSPGGAYTLTAVPHLVFNAETGDQIRSLDFIASEGYDRHMWTVVNQRRFVVDSRFLSTRGLPVGLFEIFATENK
jgi:hypothetical protein